MAKRMMERPKRGRPPGSQKKPEDLHVRLVTTLHPDVARWLRSLSDADTPAAGLRALVAKYMPKSLQPK